MRHFGRVTSLKHLPCNRQSIEYVRKAAELNRASIKKPADLKPNIEPEPAPAEHAEEVRPLGAASVSGRQDQPEFLPRECLDLAGILLRQAASAVLILPRSRPYGRGPTLTGPDRSAGRPEGLKG